MRMHCFAKGVAASALIGVAAASQAIVAFDNFGPGDTFNTSTGYTVAGPQILSSRPICQFTSLATGMLDTITVPVGYVSGTNGLTLKLYNDGGDVLGSFMVLWYTSHTFPTFGQSYAPYTFTNVFTDPNVFPQLVLQAGTKYWIGMEPTADDSWLAWNWNTVGDTGLMGFSHDSGSTWDYEANDTRPAFRVEVYSPNVPGPAALLPFAVGLLVAWRRRR